MLRPTPTALPFTARRKLAEFLATFSKNDAFEFHLAGSYYFKVATAESDVDLYVEYSTELVRFLMGLDFAPIGYDAADLLAYPSMLEEATAPGEHGNNTYSVFAHRTQPIHIQIFYDLPLALKARDILAKAFCDEHTRTRGPARARMWKAAIDAAREILAADAGEKQQA